MLSNSEVQSILREGIFLSCNESVTKTLVVAKAFSASGNDIPTLKGKGLEEAIALAQSVISEPSHTAESHLLVKATKALEHCYSRAIKLGII